MSKQINTNTFLHQLAQEPISSLEEKKQKIDELCDSWAADKSIPKIFSEIERQRLLTRPRDASV